MVKMTHHIWVITTQKHTVTVDSSYNQFFLVVVTGPFLQCKCLADDMKWDDEDEMSQLLEVLRQRGRVVRASGLKSVGRGFKSRSDH